MAAQGLVRSNLVAPDSRAAGGTFISRAVRGESPETLLRAAAGEMLDAGGADRAGLWLLCGKERQSLEGVVVQAGGGIAPDQWRKLDPNIPAIRDMLQCDADEIFLRGGTSAEMRLPPLVGAAKALCLPLRVAGAHLGLAMVAWKKESTVVDPLPIRALADEVALAAAAWATAGREPSSRDLSVTTKSLSFRAQEAEAQLASVAESSDAGIVLFDSNGDVRLANDRFAQILGIPRQPLLDIRTWEALAGAISCQFRDPTIFMKRWEQIAACPGEASWDELELSRPAHRTLERFVRPVRDAAGELLGRLEIYRDVTNERLAHTKLLRTEKMAGLGQLISGIAHELNNPLTSIMGYSQLLLGRRLTTAQAADGRLIYQEAERAARIVKNLLLFARETRPERRPVHLNEIVERTLALRNYELRVENIELKQDLAPGLPPVIADSAQMQQVLLNLIVNAEQAIRQSTGEGIIRIRTWQKVNGRVMLEIADSGPGISSEIIPRIFDPFFSTKPAGSGTGLGLSITFGIIQEHGGEITVESQPGLGAKFILELPAGTPAGTIEPARTQSAGARQRKTLALPQVVHTGRVLVIEDEPTVAHLIADVLGEEGRPVEIVLNGQEGLDRALAGQYDLVICDLRMPGVDGRAIFRELVARGSPLRNRLIFVTGDTLAPRTLEFMETAGVPYLAKPFLVEELKAIVEQALDSANNTAAEPGDTGLLGQFNSARS